MILKDLENILLQSDSKLSEALFKAKVLGSRLKNEDLKKWADLEINGYINVEDIPSYRKIKSFIYGDFAGAFGSGIKNARIPTAMLDGKAQVIFNDEYYFFQSIGALEQMIKDNTSYFQFPYSGNHVLYLNILLKEKGFYPEMECLGAWKIISVSQVVEVINNIRNKLLSIVLEFQEMYPDETKEDDLLHNIPETRSKTIINNYISGGSIGNIVSGEVNNINIKDVRQNDFDSLKDYLKTLNLKDEDLDKLKLEIDEDIKKGFVREMGEGVKKWILDITNKTLQSSLVTGGTQAIPLIVKAIESYFDINK